MIFFAHSLEGEPPEKWQPLDVHLTKVSILASSFAREFDSFDWAWNAGMLHDFGKAAPEFQAYLRRENQIDDEEYDGIGLGRVNHSSAGAMLAEEIFNQNGRPFGRVLSYLVAGHHAGLPDYYPCDGGMGALQKRLEEGKVNLEHLRHTEDQLIQTKQDLSNLPKYAKKENFHFWVRMLFSCLVDADYLDTEFFMEPDRVRYRKQNVDLALLKTLLDQHMMNIKKVCDNTPVNRARDEILRACCRTATEPSGLFSLTVPTGGGKILSAMSFALDHAIQHGKHRVIYVIPYTSIIEQTALTLAVIFGKENVIEHHSNLDPEKETPRMRLASENWDAPIIVTTNVQFFESLFAARSSRCRKLHNIVNSVVIMDEAQLVPPNKLTPCVAAINELTVRHQQE